MGNFVSLFRAINVGGHSAVKMPELKALHEAMGLKNVAAYLQTGNVVFESDSTDSSQLTREISQEFEKKFGFATEVMVRSGAELKELARHNPFTQPEKESKWVVVLFLSAAPEAQAKEALLSAYKGPEEIFFVDKEVFTYYSEGIGRSKLTNVYIEKKLKVLCTGRNWNTVTKLMEMAQA